MNTYASILLYAMPTFLGLVVLEKLYGYFVKKDPILLLDTVSSLNSGFTNSLKDVLGLSFTILGYKYLYDHIAIFSIKNSLLTYFVAFMSLDFAGYWVHRLSHSINFFWNKHAIHHSSEEFNLGCALRQSISTFVNIFAFFLLPAAVLGVDPKVIAVIGPIHLFAQFWYHTVYIGNLGILEHIIVTPSHHRVHHALNPEYLDKNLGQIFIFWDKIFGTFQAELPQVKPVYGITRPSLTWNPIKINFQHMWLLITDAFRADKWQDKVNIWFKPTGWRPEGFETKYPVTKINDPYNYKKYYTSLPSGASGYIYLQFFTTLGMVSLLYFNIANLNLSQMLAFAAIIYLHIYAYSEFMDNNPQAYLMEFVKNITGIILVIFSGYLDGLFTNLEGVKQVLLTYFLASSIISLYFRIKATKNLKMA